MAAKHPGKNVIMDNNPWEQGEISYLVNEVKIWYLLRHHELTHWDLVGRNDWDIFTEMQKFRETAFKEKSQKIELLQWKSKNQPWYLSLVVYNLGSLLTH